MLLGDPVRFLSGADSGFIAPVELTVPQRSGDAGSGATVQMIAWPAHLGDSPEEAMAKYSGAFVGVSFPVNVFIQQNPGSPAASLTGLQAFSIAGPIGGGPP